MANEIEIKQWLNSDLRIENKIKNLEDDMRNGYIYRDILMRLGLNVPSSIINKNDDATIKQNYQTIAGILREKLKVTLMPKPGNNLEVLKQLNKFHVTKIVKQNNSTVSEDTDQNLIAQFNKSLKTKDRHLKSSFKYDEQIKQNLPPKIMDIELKLEKFRQQKLKSEILAKTLKDQEIERENQWRIEHRQYEINKTRNNHKYIEDKTKNIHENWLKTQQVKQTRIDKEQTLNNYLTNRLKDEVKAVDNFEFKEYKEGLDYFKENCIQQGVSLRHDPDNYKPPPLSYFNLNATMMRIRESTHKSILARKDKEKRKNRMLVEQQKYEKEIQEKKRQQDLLTKFCELSVAGAEEGRKIYVAQEKDKIVVKNRIEKENQIQKERIDYFDQKHEEFRDKAIAEEIERKKQWKLQKVEYMELNLQNKIQKRKKHSKTCQDFIDIILDITELCHNAQRQNNSIRVPEQYWRDLMERFAEGRPLCEEKVVTIFEQQQQTQRQAHEVEISEELDQQLSMMFSDYNLGFQMWQPFHQFEQPENQILNHAYNDDQLGDFLHQVIDKIYPQKAIQSKPEDIPDHMPLRISIIGNRFSGKKSLSQLIKQKYGVEIIDVYDVLDQAIKYAFPPPEDENEKKKNAAKKQTKKGQVEEEKPDNPQLRELGQQANEMKTQNIPYTDVILVRAALIQIKSTFPVVTPDQLIQQLADAKAKEQERQAQMKKEWEDYLKKKEKSNPKKAAGKEGKKNVGSKVEIEVPEEAPQETYEEAVYRLMNQKEFEYTPGFVLVNFPQNVKQAKLLEEGLTGFVLEEERLNPEGEQLKEQIAQLVRAGEKTPDTSLKQGGIDLVINLNVDETIAEKRAANRRLDPQTGNIYNLEDNLPPLEEKGLADRIQPIDDPQSSLEKIQEANKQFIENLDYLQEWYGIFGFEVETAANLNTEQQQPQSQVQLQQNEDTEQDQQKQEKNIFGAIQTLESASKRIEVFEQLDQKLGGLLKIKKKKIEEQIQNYQQEQERLQQQREEERLQQENLEQERLEKEKQQQLQEASIPSNIQSNNPNPSNLSASEQQLSSQNKIPTDNLINNDVADTSKVNQTDQSMQNSAQAAGDFFGRLKTDNLKTVMKMWNEIQTSYFKEIKQSLHKIDNHREVISNRLADVQFRFLSVIQRPDDKQHKINTFKDNLNKFFDDNPQMLRFQNTKEELNQHLETLYENLWDSVEQKKNESIQERKTIMASGWFDSEMTALFSSYQRIFQLELNKLEEIIELILYIQDVVEGRPINEVQEHVILDPFHNGQLPPIYDIENPNHFPRVEQMFDHFMHCVDNISDLIGEIRAKFFKKRTAGLSFQTLNEKNYPGLNDLFNQVLETEKGICKYRGYILKFTLISRIKELKMIEVALYSKLDDWIVFGLKHENEVIYDAIRTLRQAIQSQNPVDTLVVSVKNISDTYKILNCFNQIPAYIQPLELVEYVDDFRFTIFGIKLLYEELHTLCDKRDIINLKIFENVFLRRKKHSKHLPKFIKQLPDKCLESIYANFEQQIHDDKIDFKDLMICFILFSSPVPTEDLIEEYKDQLLTYSNSGYLETHNFLHIEAWFDEYERDRQLYGQNLFNRVFFVKQLLFDLYCENEPYILSINQYIESLKRLYSKGKEYFWQILFE
ncbi:hypothetical protein ABPG72_007282 [Tetrahymena utriculariae]